MFRNKIITAFSILAFFLLGFACKNSFALSNDNIVIPYERIEVSLGKKELKINGELISSCFSSDGNKLYIATTKSMLIFDVETGNKIMSINTRERGRLVTFSNNGKLAAVLNNYDIDIWDLENNRKTSTFPKIDSIIGAMGFTPDGKILACSMSHRGRDTSKISLWNIEENREIREIDPRSDRKYDRVGDLSFSPDGKLVAIRKLDVNYIELLDVVTSKKNIVINCNSNVNAFSFIPDGSLLAVATRKGVEVWDFKSNNRINHYGKTNTYAISVDPEGNILSTSGSGYMIWHIETKGVLAQFKTYSFPDLLVFGPNKELFIHNEGQITAIWDPGYYMEIFKSNFNIQKEELETTGEFQNRAMKLKEEFNRTKKIARNYLSKLFLIEDYVSLGRYSADKEEFTIGFLGHSIPIKVTRDIAKKLIETRDSSPRSLVVKGYIKLIDDDNFELIDPYFIDTRINFKVEIRN